MIWYVNGSFAGHGNGSKAQPFRTISEAAKAACPGDEVIVAPGIYREWVNPLRGGTEDARIVYRSEAPLAAVITGAEEVKNWTKYEGQTWVAKISNGLFGGDNPYTDLVKGDWYRPVMKAHRGEVYLNGKSLYETETLDGVTNPVKNMRSWDPEGTLLTWYTEQDGEGYTLIYANFAGKDPNQENVEINVRRNCFYPDRTGLGYITLSGFTVRQAATNWAPPTAYQEGMVGPHWSKGWIIEDCEISHSKCSGISLGKYLQPNNENKWTTKYFKDGTQNERDAICQAQYEGWTKERIGSHIVRRCNIHDCGQTGIVGHLGGVFSVIEDNDIHHINNKQNLAGAEIGGIKMHAAIDVVIRRNHIHHCSRGLWLDWQAQGTRVSQNLFHDNEPPRGTELMSAMAVGEDLFVEVSHGPTLIDNNLFLSTISARLCTQGLAFVHNLIAGAFVGVGMGTDNSGQTLHSRRYTPYHIPHRTEVAGFMTIQHGDARFYNNIFVQKPLREDAKAKLGEGPRPVTEAYFTCGTKPYDGYPTEEWYAAQFSYESSQDRMMKDIYYMHLPVYSGGNVYFNGAKPYDGEVNYREVETPVRLDLKETDGSVRLDTDLFDLLPEFDTPFVYTDMLGIAFEPEQKFEAADCSPILFDTDFLGCHRGSRALSGPFARKDEAGEILA